MSAAAATGAARARKILARSKSVLLIDWPSRDVPATLAAAGFAVTVRGGPGPADYAAWEAGDGEPMTRPIGRAPDHVDLVYWHRPFSELPSIIATAQRLGATAIWRQTGLTSEGTKAPDGCWAPPEESQQGRELAGGAGLSYVDDIYIADTARALSGPP
jgi:predicted CoA-binding protein